MLIDLPKDVTSGPCDAPFVDEVELPGYEIPGGVKPGTLETTAKMLRRARRPAALRRSRLGDQRRRPRDPASGRKAQRTVVNTLLGKGAVDERHPLHLGMLGMHGTAYANKAVIGCDLIMAIGARWDDRITGKHRRVLHGRDEDPRRHRPPSSTRSCAPT